MKTCLYCAEANLDAASVCEHCGEMLNGESATVPATSPPPTVTHAPTASPATSVSGSTVKNGSMEKWRAVAILSIALLVPISAWFRNQAVSYEPKIASLQAEKRSLEKQVEEANAMLAAEKSKGQEAAKSAQEKLEAEQLAFKEAIAKRDTAIEKLTEYANTMEQLSRPPAVRPKITRDPFGLDH